MIPSILKKLLNRDESKILTGVATLLTKGPTPELLQSLDYGAILSQLRGDDPADGVLVTGLSFLSNLTHSEMWPVVMSWGMDALEEKGFKKSAILSLIGKSSPLLGLKLPSEGDDAERLSYVIRALNDRVKPGGHDYMGAVAVCPSCQFSFII